MAATVGRNGPPEPEREVRRRLPHEFVVREAGESSGGAGEHVVGLVDKQIADVHRAPQGRNDTHGPPVERPQPSAQWFPGSEISRHYSALPLPPWSNMARQNHTPSRR